MAVGGKEVTVRRTPVDQRVKKVEIYRYEDLAGRVQRLGRREAKFLLWVLLTMEDTHEGAMLLAADHAGLSRMGAGLGWSTYAVRRALKGLQDGGIIRKVAACYYQFDQADFIITRK